MLFIVKEGEDVFWRVLKKSSSSDMKDSNSFFYLNKENIRKSKHIGVFLLWIEASYTTVLTFGPLGPFLQSGVEVVSQLAHLRASRESLPKWSALLLLLLLLLAPPRPLFCEVEEGVCLVWKMSQQTLDM